MPSFRLLALAALLLLLPCPAGADDGAAAAHRRLAIEHVKARRYTEAAAELEREYALTKQPIVLYKIAECHRALGGERGDAAALEVALRYYEKYLAREGNGREADRSREAMAKIEAELAKRPAAPTPPSAAIGASSERPPALAAPKALAPRAATVPPPRDLAAVEPTPLHKRGWVWAIAGAVVAGTVTAVVLGSRGGGVSVPAHDLAQRGPY